MKTSSSFVIEIDDNSDIDTILSLSNKINLLDAPLSIIDKKQELFSNIDNDNYRESIIDSLGLNNRNRQILLALVYLSGFSTFMEYKDYIVKNKKNIWITEDNSRFSKLFIKLFGPKRVSLSEYMGPDYLSGQIVNGVLNQDITNSSYESNSFDLIITQDIFEHIPNYIKGEKECYRILKQGGWYVFSVPCSLGLAKDQIRTFIKDGQEIDLLDRIYHRDPIRTEGILVYQIFSVWDIKKRFEAMGAAVKILSPFAPRYGIVGPGNIVFAIQKPI
jgi:SAM-dependent methyltransferase